MFEETVIAQRYEVTDLLGKYVFYSLYQGFDNLTQKNVLIAFFHQESDEYASEEYQKLEQKLMSLSHPYLISLLNFGTYDRRRYLVMPNSKGQLLSDYLKNKPQPFKRVRKWGTSLGMVLAYLHKNDVVYTRLSPLTIWVDMVGNALLLPLVGIHPPVADSTLVGSRVPEELIRYNSPESIRGEEHSARSDQYVFATILYEALTGRSPYESESSTQLALSIVTGLPEDAQKWRDDIPDTMNSALLQALSKQASNRFQSVTDFIEVFMSDLPPDNSKTETGLQYIPTTTNESSQEVKTRQLFKDELPDRLGDLFDTDDLDLKKSVDESPSKQSEIETKRLTGLDEAVQEALREMLEEGSEDLTNIPVEKEVRSRDIGYSNGTSAEPEPEEAFSSVDDKPAPPPGAPQSPPAPPQPQPSQVDIKDVQERRQELLAQLMVQRLLQSQAPSVSYGIEEEIKKIEEEIDEISKQIPSGNGNADSSLVQAEAQFTAYYSRESVADVPYGLYVYAHIPNAFEAIEIDVQAFADELGGQVPNPKQADQSPELEVGIPITVMIECDGLAFEPLAMTKSWEVPFTRFDFLYIAPDYLIGEIVTGRISLLVKQVEIANIPFTTLVKKPHHQLSHNDTMPENPLAAAKFVASGTATIYNKIFVSYSRKDLKVANNYRLAQIAVGHDVFMDSYSIRSGEDWRAALATAIDTADIFQLFWSEHSATSKNVRDEWRYALEYKCAENQCVNFIRPVYWEKPLPMPPEEIGHLNFRYVPFEE